MRPGDEGRSISCPFLRDLHPLLCETLPMSVFTLNVNGQSHMVDVDPATPLLYVLSDDLALKGPKFGCGLGQCGACTAIVNGRAVRTCQMPISAAGGADVTTLEGLGTPDRPHPI